jgi:hypothetical protein
MKIKQFCLAGLAALAVGQMTSAHSADVARFGVAKGQDYFQTNATTVLTLTNNRPFKFTSFLDGAATDSVQSVSLKLPNTQVRALTNNDGNFEFETGFTNKTSLDAAYGPGSYTYTIIGINDGTNKPALALPADNFPPVPKLANWTDLQAVEADQPLHLSWGAYTNGTTNDFIFVSVATPDGDTVVSTPAWFGPNALNGTNLTAQIPADSLDDGTTYLGSLLFVKRTTLSTNYPGAKGAAGYFRQTDFPLVTLPAPPVNGRIQFAASSFSALENSGTASILLTRSGDAGAVSVDLRTQAGTAQDGQDYQGVNQQINFTNGQTSIAHPLTLNDDFLLNGNRTLTLVLNHPQGGAEIGTRSNAVLIIADNESAAAGRLQFAVLSNSVPEGGKFITLTVNRVGGSTGTVTAEYFAYHYSFGDTARPGLNYLSTNGTLTFGPGITSKTITVPIVNNSIYETNPVFHVALTNPTSGAALGTNSIARVTIINDDFGGAFAFKQSTYATNENAGSFLVTVVRTGGAASGVTVDYATADGSALAGVRYFATNGTLSFGSNELSKTFQVGITNDLIPNGDQNFTVSLSHATGGATVSTNPALNTARLSVIDDESSIAFTNAAYVISEAAGTFTVTAVRSGALFTQVGVDFATADNTALAGRDFRATTGTLAFPPNVKSKTISVTISNNTLVEPDKSFFISLSNPTNGVQLGAITNVSVTITNKDLGGVINFARGSYLVSEAVTNAILSLVRSNGLASGVSVDITPVTGTAVAGLDYSNPVTTVTFNAGETSRKVLVPVINNNVVDSSRTVVFALNNPQGGAAIGTNFGNACQLTITNDDVGGIISFTRTNYSVNENATNVYLSISRTGGKATGVGAFYKTRSGTAVDGPDFAGITNKIFFSVADTNKIITIPILNDTLAEGNETFTISLYDVLGGATLGSATNATVSILDDESSISISNAAVSVSEAAGNVIVTLVRSGALTTTVSVNIATANGSAFAGLDYVATNGMVTFPANISTKTITIPIVNDTIVEETEFFTVAISNPQGGVQLGATTSQEITINDNDLAGTIQFGATSFSGTEGGTAVINVTRTGGLASGISANFVMSGGTATSSVDYTNLSATLTFAAGETNKTILVPIIADALTETTETVNLSLSGPHVGAPATAVLSLADKPDPNAVPIAGPVFMKGMFGSTPFNASSVLANTTSGGGINIVGTFFTGGLSQMIILPNPFALGTVQMDNSGNHGLFNYYGFIGGSARAYTVANGPSAAGTYGTVIFDAIDTVSKRVSGRFTFHCRETTDTVQPNGAFVNVTGSFRTTYN